MDANYLNLSNAVNNLTGQLIAYQMLCQALIVTHQDRQKLEAAYMLRAGTADDLVSDDRSPDLLREAFEKAHNNIIAAIRRI